MPAEPLFYAHGEQVEVLLHLLDQRDRLDDRLVLTVHVELHVVTRERVGQTQLGFVHLPLEFKWCLDMIRFCKIYYR